MKRLGWLASAVLLVGAAAMTALYAQGRLEQGAAQSGGAGPFLVAQAPGGGPGGGARWGEMSEAERAKMREQMQERRLEEAGLAEKEKAAARKALKAKEQARQALADELVKLQRAANRSNPTEKHLQQALSAYRAALAQYRKKIAAEDTALVRQLSLRSQVRCMSLGVLDNGLAFGGGRMGMGGGLRGGRGGPGGGRSRGF